MRYSKLAHVDFLGLHVARLSADLTQNGNSIQDNTRNLACFTLRESRRPLHSAQTSLRTGQKKVPLFSCSLFFFPMVRVLNESRMVMLPTGAFVCHRQKYPNDQQYSLIFSHAVQTDPNFTAAWLRGPGIGAVQATSWWNHAGHSQKTLAQCS